MNIQNDDTHELLVIRSLLFEQVDSDDFRSLIKLGISRSFRRGTFIFHRGDAADGLYLLVEGKFRVVLESKAGSEVTIAILQRGDVLGDLSLLDGMGRSATGIAMTAVKTLFVSASNFEGWLSTHPSALRAIAAGLALRVRVNTEQIADLSLFDARSRVARCVWQAFARAIPGQIPQAEQVVHFNQSEAASGIGVARETLNKELHALAREGILTVQGRDLRLNDPTMLRARVPFV